MIFEAKEEASEEYTHIHTHIHTQRNNKHISASVAWREKRGETETETEMLETSLTDEVLPGIDPLWLAQSKFRRRKYQECVEICTENLHR